jgi:hypothetical protein
MAATLNPSNLIYLFIRLAPFIIVSFFTLQSIFNQDLRGIVYLTGLIIACCVVFVIGKLENFKPQTTANVSNFISVCNTLTLGDNGPISNLPLSQSILGYTLAYLSVFIGLYSLESSNIATFIILPLMILGDYIWNIQNNCVESKSLLFALVIGGTIGTVWGFGIHALKDPRFEYISGKSSNEVCTMPTQTLMKCRVRPS